MPEILYKNKTSHQWLCQSHIILSSVDTMDISALTHWFGSYSELWRHRTRSSKYCQCTNTSALYLWPIYSRNWIWECRVQTCQYWTNIGMSDKGIFCGETGKRARLLIWALVSDRSGSAAEDILYCHPLLFFNVWQSGNDWDRSINCEMCICDITVNPSKTSYFPMCPSSILFNFRDW